MTTTPLRTRMLDLAAGVAGRSISEMGLEEIRRTREMVTPGVPPFTWVTGPVRVDVGIEDRWIGVRDDGRVRLRFYTPSDDSPTGGRSRRPGARRGVLLFVHGGGWVLGNVANYDPLCTHLARSVDIVVVSVDYRLAPEHPAPAAIHDVQDALAWVATHAGEFGGVGGVGGPIGIAGDSAGGNLATVVAQLSRDAGAPSLACQALLYPAVDSTCLYRSKVEHADGPILSRRDGDTFFRHYLGSGPDALDSHSPLVSPLLGRLDGLPPTLIQVAGLDSLRDEGLAYAEALSEAGVTVESTTYARAPHGFASFPGLSVGAWGHRRQLVDFLTRHLRGAA